MGGEPRRHHGTRLSNGLLHCLPSLACQEGNWWSQSLHENSTHVKKYIAELNVSQQLERRAENQPQSLKVSKPQPWGNGKWVRGFI